jgi:hypothetical protein
MTDFVVYHNTDQMGELTDSGEWLSVLTNKSHLDVLGERIWLIVGEGQPRKYYLGMWLRAEAVEPDATGVFSTEIRGRGRVLGKDERPLLNDASWFAAFLRRQGSFGFGLNPVGDAAVERELETLAERAERRSVEQAD